MFLELIPKISPKLTKSIGSARSSPPKECWPKNKSYFPSCRIFPIEKRKKIKKKKKKVEKRSKLVQP